MMKIDQNDQFTVPITNNKSNAIPEFVRKLFSMLEENSFPSILTWGLKNDTFIIIEPNEFSKYILPQHFKHSNFASFVRQLNKYDFHKIRGQQSTSSFGNQAWEFKHIHFKCNRKDLIYKIKRKPTKKSNKKKEIKTDENFIIDESMNDYLENISQQLYDTQQSYLTLTSRLDKMVQNYQNAVETVIFFKNSLKTQDELIQKMISTTILKSENQIMNNNHLYPFIQSYQVLTKKEDDKLTEIINHTKKNQLLLTSCLVSHTNKNNNEEKLTIIPSQPKWEYSPRVLLIFFNHHHQYHSQIYQWIQSFGCMVDSLYLNYDDTDTMMLVKTSLLIKKSFDMLFFMSDGLLNSKKISLLNMIRQKDSWLPIIDNTIRLVEPENYWLKQGVTEIISNYMDRKQLCHLISKYCSHLKLK